MVPYRLPFLVDGSANDAFKFNKETEFIPILGLAQEQLNVSHESPQKHHPALLATLSEELSVTPELISDMELSLYDTQLSVIGQHLHFWLKLAL